MKTKRQLKIIELIKTIDIETQEELCTKLCEAGFDVTQATISRDIKALRLSKVSTFDDKVKYCIFSDSVNEADNSDKFIRVFKEAALSIDYAGNIIVIKTIIGMAMAVAACIDSMNDNDILGSIAGDDTIFCTVKSEEIAINIIDRFNSILSNKR